MMSKLKLIFLAVLVQSCVLLVRSTLVAEPEQNSLEDHFSNFQDHDLKMDPNYEFFSTLHKANPESYPLELMRDLLAKLRAGGISLKEVAQRDTQVKSPVNLPDTFDAREKWRKCKRIINTIYDQGPLKSDYAIAAASMFADRLCIKTNGKFRSLLSAQKVFGCFRGERGHIIDTLRYIKNNGVPTGGLYGSKKGCIPFELEPCAHGTVTNGFGGKFELNAALPNCTTLKPKNYTCPTACTNSKYSKEMDKDLHKPLSVHRCTFIESLIRQEIMDNGPVVTSFAMWTDFRTYKEGIYRQSPSAEYEYFHEVKLIGWGTENGTDYWLGVNSFNKAWGMKGLFKFPRGIDYKAIELLNAYVKV